MSTFIMLGLTVYMLVTYIRSLKVSNKSLANGHIKYLKQLDELEKEGLTKAAIRRSTIFLLFIATLVFITYYVMTSLIIGEYWAAFAAATFSVISVRNFLLAVDYFTTLEFKKTSVFTRLIEVLGLIYTTYFLYFYVNLKFSGVSLFVVISIIIVMALTVMFVKNKNEKIV